MGESGSGLLAVSSQLATLLWGGLLQMGVALGVDGRAGQRKVVVVGGGADGWEALDAAGEGDQKFLGSFFFTMRPTLWWFQMRWRPAKTVHVNKTTDHFSKQHLSTCPADSLALHQPLHVYHPSTSLPHFALMPSFTRSPEHAAFTLAPEVLPGPGSPVSSRSACFSAGTDLSALSPGMLLAGSLWL